MDSLKIDCYQVLQNVKLNIDRMLSKLLIFRHIIFVKSSIKSVKIDKYLEVNEDVYSTKLADN